ncbi:MAG: DUF4397 domain-containing protein [Bacteroidetes bacterium]|nr:DUF4397 domain-containing protein [Bacteroidota bacterium]
MKYIRLSLLLISAGALMLGCQDPDYPAAVPSSTVRSANVVFINAAPDISSPQSFLVNNAAASSIAFPGAVLTTINPSTEQFRIKNAVFGVIKPDTLSQKADLVSQTGATTIQGNGHYTVILTDTVKRPFGKASAFTSNPGGLTFTTITDVTTAPTAGNSGIRFLNLAPGAAAVYLTHDGGQTFTGLTTSVAYKKTTTTFTSVPTGTYVLEVRTGSVSGTVIATLPSQAYADGKLYTVFLSGKVVKVGSSNIVKVPYAVNAVAHN